MHSKPSTLAAFPTSATSDSRRRASDASTPTWAFAYPSQLSSVFGADRQQLFAVEDHLGAVAYGMSSTGGSFVQDLGVALRAASDLRNER